MSPPRSDAPTPQDDVPKGALEMLILKTLTIQPMHGYAIVRHIERSLGRRVRHRARLPLPRARATTEQRGDRRQMAGVADRTPRALLHDQRRRPSPARGKSGGFDRVWAAIDAVMNGN